MGRSVIYTGKWNEYISQYLSRPGGRDLVFFMTCGIRFLTHRPVKRALVRNDTEWRDSSPLTPHSSLKTALTNGTVSRRFSTSDAVSSLSSRANWAWVSRG